MSLSEQNRAQDALRWIYKHGFRHSSECPASVNEAFNQAFANERAARAEGVAALQQAGDLISRENLEAELRETIGLYVREAVTRMFSEENATYRCARQIAGMLQPGYYLHRKLFSSPLPQQTALVEPYSPDLDDVNGRLA